MINRWNIYCFCFIGMLYISIASADEYTSYPKLFNGTINNKINIQMTLTREGSDLSGSYFYTGRGKNLTLKGTVDANGNILINELDSSGKQTGIFKGILGDKEMSGTWSTPDGSKMFPFLLIDVDSLQYYIDLIGSSPKEAAQGLKTLRTPTANAYLAYLYYTGKVAVSNPKAEIDRLIREAVNGTEDKFGIAEIASQETFEYTNLGELLLAIRLISGTNEEQIITPCWIFREHPKEAFEAFDAYWGSTRDNFPGLCDDYGSIKEIDSVKRLSKIVDDIVGKYPLVESGTIRYSTYRSWRIEDMKASISPQLLLEDGKEPPDNWQEWVRSLEVWSNEGLWNKETYTSLIAVIPKSIEVLKNYFTSKFGMDDKSAEKVSKIAISSIIDHINEVDFGENDGPSINFSEDIAYMTFTNPHLDVSQATRLVTSGMLKQEGLDRALKYAVLNNLPLDIIRLLVENGAKSDEGDESALMMAVKRPDVIRYLLENGANPNYQNGFGKTALFHAAQYNVLESASMLIEKGAQVNHAIKTREKLEEELGLSYFVPYSSDADDAQMAPLMYAARYASMPFIRFLIEHGADISAKDFRKSQAIDYLEQNPTLQKADQELARQLLTHPTDAKHLQEK